MTESYTEKQRPLEPGDFLELTITAGPEREQWRKQFDCWLHNCPVAKVIYRRFFERLKNNG